MEYRRVKYTRWKNVQCAVKNAIYKYYQKDKESFKTKNKHIGRSKVFTYDSYYQLDANCSFARIPTPYLRVNVNIIIRELQYMFRNSTSEKYFQAETTDTYERTLTVNDHSEVVDLYMIAKLYGNIQKKTFDEKIEAMTIMELTWGDEKIPVVLDYLFKDPDESTYGLLESYLRNLKGAFCPYDSIRWLISQLLAIPTMESTGVVPSETSDKSDLEEYVLTVVTMMKRGLPAMSGYHMDDYYDNVQFFFDQLSNAGLNMTYVYANPEFTKIFTSGDPFNLKQMEMGRSSEYTAMNLSRDLCQIVNYVIKMNARKSGEITNKEQCKIQQSYYVLGKFGIGLDVVKTASYEDNFVNYISMPDAEVNNNDFSLFRPYDIDRMANSYKNLLTMLHRMTQFDMFWISVFDYEDDTKRRIELLSQVSFLALMKSYIAMSEYIDNNDFKEAAYPYLINDRNEITLGIVFEAFRLYYKDRKDPFVMLPYVALPITLSRMIHSSYTRYIHEYDPFSKVFSIEDVPYIPSGDQRIEKNNKALKRFELIMLFLYRSCITYESNGLLTMDEEHYSYRFVKSANVEPINQVDRLVEIRYGVEDNRKDDITIANDTLRCHLQPKMCDGACDTIKSDVFEYASKFKEFETACYNISYYTSSGYKLSREVDGIRGEIIGAPVDMESAMWVFRMLRK